MTLYDTVISGGMVVTPEGQEKLDIGVQGSIITAIDKPGSLNSRRYIKAENLTILPGLVDVHVHLRDPGFTHKEDFLSGTAEAAAGGITTVIAQPNTNPPITDAQSLVTVRKLGEGRAYVDFGISGLCIPGESNNIAAMAKAGAASVEILMADGPVIFSTETDIHYALVAAQETGIPAAIYAVDQNLAIQFQESVNKRTDPKAQADSRPNITEASAIQKVLNMVKKTKIPVSFRQVSTREGIEFLRSAKESGMDVRVEVNPQHLFLTKADLVSQGPFASVYPPLRELEDTVELWAAILDGTVDWIGTDHAPHALEEKESGHQNIFDAPGGLPGLRTLLPLLINAVNCGQIDLTRVVEILCSVPAKLFGFPRKGKIEIGADADLVIVDLNLEKKPVERPIYSKAKTTPYDHLSL